MRSKIHRRQTALRHIVASEYVTSAAQATRILRSQYGIKVNEATVSVDFHALGIHKISGLYHPAAREDERHRIGVLTEASELCRAIQAALTDCGSADHAAGARICADRLLEMANGKET